MPLIDFWTIFAAVLAANLLTAMFVAGMVAYSRHEREGTAGSRASHFPALSFLLPLFFLVGGLYIAFGGV